MNRNLYLEIRRLVNVVRSESPVESRFIFDEFATMCALFAHGPTSMSELAARQDISGPTMAHRSSHMLKLGLIERVRDQADRRRVRCLLSERGMFVVEDTLGYILENLENIPEFAHIGQLELADVVSWMGRLPMTADSLVLFCFAMRDASSLTVKHIVHATAMQQPTVSMAMLRLEYDGYIEQAETMSRDFCRPKRRSSGYVITKSGMRFGKKIVSLVEEL